MPWRALLCIVMLLVTIETFAGKVKYLHSQKLCKAQQKNKLTAENENRLIFRKKRFSCFLVCFWLFFFFFFFFFGYGVLV